MKITINRKSFLDALSVGGALAGKAKSIPILEQVLIRVADNTLTVVSSNSESQVLKRISIVESEGNISFCANPNDLSKALKSLNTEDITLDASTELVKVVHSKGCIEFPASSPVAFPIMPKNEDAKVVTLPSALLKDWINIGRNFVSNDNFKPAMNGMFISIEGNTITCCATDAHKLFSDSATFDNTDNVAFNVIVSSQIFPMILNILNDDESVDMLVDSNNLSFKSGSSKVTTRKIEDAYPNFRMVIPTNNQIKIGVNRDEFKQAILRTSLFTNAGTSLAKLEIKDSVMSIIGQDINFGKGSYEEINIENSNSELTIGVKADYTQILLSAISTENLIIELSSPERPLIFKDSNYPNMCLLLMPMKLG